MSENKIALITGASGFIGHHLVQHLLLKTDWCLVLLIRNSSAGDWQRLEDIKENFPDWDERVRVIRHDLMDSLDVVERHIGNVDFILHLGANSDVDYSIAHPVEVIKNNVMSTVNLLEYARQKQPSSLFVYFSTDEVFGNSEGHFASESDPHRPRNPYSASKAGAEDACLAYANTYKLPVIITNTMNCFGERQEPTKFIPLCIYKILAGDEVIVHAYPDLSKAGSRTYIHARNASDALLFVLKNGKAGERYNIVGEQEVDNLSLAQMIAEILGKPLRYKLVNFHESRSGHDLLYRLDGTKLRDMGWQVPDTFPVSLEKTVQWYLDNRIWLV